jgi:hypothetical protein
MLRYHRKNEKYEIFSLLCLSIILLLDFMLPAPFGSAVPENKTLMQPQGVQGMATNTTNNYKINLNLPK